MTPLCDRAPSREVRGSEGHSVGNSGPPVPTSRRKNAGANLRSIRSIPRQHAAHQQLGSRDSSAHHVVGAHLWQRPREPLYELARSASLWERRIAIIATLHFIKNEDYEDTFALAAILLNDDQDLIHKAVGWMLREAGNRNLGTEEAFRSHHYRRMPRTMLRYAIEKFPEPKRKAYLRGEI